MLWFFKIFQTLTFLAANRPTSSFESSGLTDIPRGVIVNPTNIAVSVPEGELLAEEDLPSVTPQSVIPFNEYTSHFHPPPALPEDQRSGVILHHNDKSSEEQSIVHLQMDLKHSQISTTSDSNNNLRAAYSLYLLPDYDLSTNKVSETTTAEGTTRNTYHDVDVRIQDGLNILTRHNNEEQARIDVHIDDHNSSSVTSVFDSKHLDLSDRPTEGSGSGSALDSNELSQDFDEVATVWTDVYLTLVDDTEKETTAAKTAAETDNDTEGTSSAEGGKKDWETEAVKGIEKNEIELNGEEEEKIVQRIGNQRVRKVNGETDESVQQLNSAADCDMLKEKEGETDGETLTGKKIYTEISSGVETESSFRVFSWPGDMSGSGEGSGDRGDDGEGKGKKVSDHREYIKAVAEKASDGKGGKEVGRQDGLQLSVHQDEIKADFPLFGSSEEGSNEGSDKHNEEDQNKSLDRSVGGGDFSLEDSSEVDGHGKGDEALESEEHIEGGGKQLSDAAVTGERLQQFSSVDGLFFDAAGSPVLGRLVPVLRLADASKAKDEQKEGKCYMNYLSIFQLLLLVVQHVTLLFCFPAVISVISVKKRSDNSTSNNRQTTLVIRWLLTVENLVVKESSSIFLRR